MQRKSEQEAINVLRGQGIDPENQGEYFSKFIVNLDATAAEVSPKRAKAKV